MTDASVKKYIVSAYENSEIPDPFWIDKGGFDCPDDAIRCAEGIVDRSLSGFFEPGMSAEDRALLLMEAVAGVKLMMLSVAFPFRVFRRGGAGLTALNSP